MEALSCNLRHAGVTHTTMLEKATRVGMLLTVDAKLLDIVGTITVSD